MVAARGARMPLLDRLFYYPNRTIYERPENHHPDSEYVGFRTTDGVHIEGLFIPAAGRARGTVLHLHGNAANLTAHFPHVAWLPRAGWNVLCFDYRGYGNSEGRPSRAGTVRDAHAALDYLLSRPDIEHDRIVAFGQSLGGAIGIVLAAERREIRGVATDGAFDHYRRIVAWHIRRSPLLFVLAWWLPLLGLRDGFDPIDYVGRIAPRPVLILHGTADRIVDPRMARRLYEAAGEPKELLLIEGTDHYQAMEEDGERLRPRLLSFFETCVDTAMKADYRPFK